MKKAPMLTARQTAPIGKSMRESDMPADFIARSSLLSAKLPRVIIEASRVASGRESGRRVHAPHIINSIITLKPRPLPTSSSM